MLAVRQKASWGSYTRWLHPPCRELFWLLTLVAPVLELGAVLHSRSVYTLPPRLVAVCYTVAWICHQLCLHCAFDTWVFPWSGLWSRGQIYVSFTLVLTEKTSLTHPWPHFLRTSLTFFLFMILERVILSSWLPWASVLQPASWAFSLQREPYSVKFVSFSNSSLCNHPNISLHSNHFFLALLPSALFSGTLPTSLCAPATQGVVDQSVLQLLFLLSA